MRLSIKIKEALTELSLSSTWHGIPSICRTKRIFFKIMWTIFSIGSTAACIYFITLNVNEFLKDKIVTKMELLQDNPSQFPAVSFCNLNPNSTISNLNDSVIMCKFGSIICTPNEFKIFYDPSIGLCFMFNSGRNQQGHIIRLESSTKAGSYNGLKVMIFAGSQMTDEPSSPGFRVYVHNSSNVPNINIGYNVPIGMDSRISIRREFRKILNKPYNPCLDLNPIGSFYSDIFKEMLKLNDTYSQKKCFNYLAWQEIARNCSCDPQLGLITSMQKNCTDEPRCSRIIYENFFTENDYEKLSKKCPLECLTIDYRGSVSFSDIVAARVRDKINKNIFIKSKFDNKTITYEKLKKTVLDVSVYYEELSYTFVSQSPDVELLDLSANIGGLLGLFVGTSFLSLVEILEMAFEVCFIVYENKKNKVRTK